MNKYSLRREKFIELLPDNSMAIIFSGSKVMMGNDESYPFVVDKNFLYFTGIDEADLILKITKVNGSVNENLYIQTFDELMAKWVGPTIRKQKAQEISGIKQVSEVVNFNKDFGFFYSNIIRTMEDFTICLDLYRYNFNDDSKQAMKFAKELQNNYPQLKLKDIMPMMQKLRWIKNEDEIEDTKKAIAITKEGIEAMMSYIKAGVNERELSGVFNFTLSKHLSSNAFKSICASGVRATILHYNDNSQIVQDGELFLCDLGATHNYYQADISRVFPVNGKFSVRQKEIYTLVLNAQKLVENAAKPGITIRELQKLVIDYYSEQLPKFNLNKSVNEYYFHGIGHQLGLDTHDLSTKGDIVLKPGMLITNEPGLYIEDEAIGVRIEDDLLITEDGCINLSKDIIKEIDEIEAFMASNG